jgi:hypothetical protein
VSWFDGVPAYAFSVGPPADYTLAQNNGTAQTQLLVTASGNFYLPQIPAGFWQLGKPGQAVFLHLAGTMTSNSATGTITINVGLNSAAATAGGTAIPATTAIWQSPALVQTVTTAGLGWEVDLRSYTRAVGYGTSATSTSLQTVGIFSSGTLQQVGNALAQPITNIDASVTQYVWATANWGVSSASNFIKCQLAIAYGMS